jgi:membrane protease YdiL (CAAX protease family)
MKLLTLTPDTHVYVVAVVVVYALACAPLAGHLVAILPVERRPRFLPIYVLTMSAVAAVALATLSLPSVTESSPRSLAFSTLLGLGAGVLAIRCDSAVRRLAQRKARQRRRGPSVTPPPGPARAAPGTVEVVDGSVATLGLLLTVALLEEVLFRGILVDLTLDLSSTALAVAGLAGTVAVFASAHVYWGLIELLAKLPLGVLALAAALPFRCVVGAVAAHVLFNAWSWVAVREA